jgi:hypothetical protein
MNSNLNSNVRVGTPAKASVGNVLSSNIGTRIGNVITAGSNLVKHSNPVTITGTGSGSKPANVKVVRHEVKANKVSGYTPLMMQGSIAPQNRLSTAFGSSGGILHPTASTFQPKQSQYRQARELLLQPGFEAQA